MQTGRLAHCLGPGLRVGNPTAGMIVGDRVPYGLKMLLLSRFHSVHTTALGDRPS